MPQTEETSVTSSQTTAPPRTDESGAVPPAIRAAASWSWRMLLIGAFIAAALWLLALLKTIVVPVAVALLLTIMLTPVRRLLNERLRVPRGLSAGLSLIGLIVVVAGLITLAGQSIANGFADLRTQAISGFNELWSQLSATFGLQEELDSYSRDILDQLEAQQSAIVSGALGAAATAGSVLVGALIALFCTFFFLHDPRGIWGWIVGLLPRSARERVNQAGRRGAVTLAAYTRTQILVAAVDAVGIGIGAVFFVPSLALPIAILVFVGSFVPVVGAIVTGAIAVVVVLVSNGWVAALIMLGVVLLVQQIESHALQPFLMGQAVSLHPVAVILAVAAGSFAAGIVGALFAVPLAAVLNTVILYLNGHDKFPELGDEDALPIRWRAADAPPIPLRLRRSPGVLADTAVDDVSADAEPDAGADAPKGDPKR
ncbi:AI-2E family transporter [Promicromonospora kroppenstedtii]|uniref:AI-2E family transporter n=1 Tax=Promicromonospora kroppenstedtii TaxID=440482 RepID=UPI001FE1B2E8|nr:AI-2E family transporter [Promicromonospora kroppenstedtii]